VPGRTYHTLRTLLLLGMASTTLAGGLAVAHPFGTPTNISISSDIEQVLSTRVYPDSPQMREVQEYAASRIPTLPPLTTQSAWEAYAKNIRQRLLDKIIFRGVQAKEWRAAKTNVEWFETIPGGPGYTIRKVRYEALPGMWIPGVLYMPENVTGRVPVHLAVNGHEAHGKAVYFKQLRCINLAKRGVATLNVDWFGNGQLNKHGFEHERMPYLDLVGEGGLAPFYLLLSRGLDLLLSQPFADPSRVMVSGLSGGGWQAILIGALDTRVTLANPVAGYATLDHRAKTPSDLGDPEQLPTDFGTIAGYRHLTALMAGRNLLLTYNLHDNCCFKANDTLPPLLTATQEIFDLYKGRGFLRWYKNDFPGTHNFERKNREALYQAAGDAFFPGDPIYNSKEIPSETEIKPIAELQVPMPPTNLDFQAIAIASLNSVPDSSVTRDRATLERLVHYKAMNPAIFEGARTPFRSGTAARLQFKMDGIWSVPVNEFTPKDPKGTTILISDAGRRAETSEIDQLLNAGHRVLAVDVLGFGGAEVGKYTASYFYLLSMLGERPLGIQSGQLLAVAKWAKEKYKGTPALRTVGIRTGIIGPTAHAIEPTAFSSVVRSGVTRSLKEVIGWKLPSNKYPELFCFDLLRHFDVPELQALASGPSTQPPPSPSNART
jgi:hypothetical protein